MKHWLVKSEPSVFSVDDLAACPDQTRWFLVDIRLTTRLEHPIALRTIMEHGETLGELPLIRKGNRLSVMPVALEQWDYTMSLKAA